MKKTIILFFVIFTTWSFSQAQPLEWSDSHIANLFERMDYWGQFCYKDPKNKKIDSLRNAGGRIYDFVENLIVMYPYSLNGEFPQSKEKGMHYATSDDGALRIYSWEAKMEGHNGCPHSEIRDIAAFKTSAGRKYHDISNGTEGAICTKITTVTTKRDITLYFANYYTVTDGVKMEKIRAYALIDNSIKEISAFIRDSKNPKQLWCDYGMSPGDAENAPSAIHFSADKTKLYIPVTEKTGAHYALTGKDEVYVFNGFMYINDKPAK